MSKKDTNQADQVSAGQEVVAVNEGSAVAPEDKPKARRRTRKAPSKPRRTRKSTKAADAEASEAAGESQETPVAVEAPVEAGSPAQETPAVVEAPLKEPVAARSPAVEPVEEDYAAQAARLADEDFDESLEEFGAASEEPVGEAASGGVAGEAVAAGGSEETGQRRRGRRRRRRGKRGRGGAAGTAPQQGPASQPGEAGVVPVEAVAEGSGETAALVRRTNLAEPVQDDMTDVEPTAEAAEGLPAAGVEVAPSEGRGRRRRRRGRGRRGRGRGEGESAGAEVPIANGMALTEPMEVEPGEAGGEEVEEEEAEIVPGKIMLVNVAQGDECRIAMLGEGKLQEFYVERTAALSHVGNIYKGVVTNIEPSIQAAFVDFGEGKNGFLHVSDLQPQYFPGGGEAEDVGRKTPRKERPPIQKCLRRNQEVIVQVTKEGIGTKGATLTTYCALPGRYLVMMPGMCRLGVSRKIEDEDARRRMRDVLNQLELPGDMGFILRTAGLDRNARELQRDLNYLVRLWRQITKRKNSIKAPAELYQESDLVTRTLRDVVTTDVEEVLIDSEPVASAARQFLSLLSPRLAARVKYYAGPEPLFFKYGVEDEIAKIYSKRVPLSSGGSLVIESTEALVAIDVNSGKFRDAPDPEESAFRINLEAAEEIARQLSLRDLGGVIICDFIDMHMERHRREIERALGAALKKHKERAEILRMSRFGIIEMTRQRQRPSIIRSMLMDCPHCAGTGMVKSNETVMLEALRAIQTAITHADVVRVEARVDAQVAQMLQNSKRQVLAELESQSGKSITVVPTSDAAANRITLTCYDHRGWPVQVPLPRSMTGAAGTR